MSVSRLLLVVACDGSAVNAALLETILPVTREASGKFPGAVPPCVAANLTPDQEPLSLTVGETLTDDQITQVARILTLRLSGQNPFDPENGSSNWPVYVSEIVREVRDGAAVQTTAEIVKELVDAGEDMGEPASYKTVSRYERAVEKARAILPTLFPQKGGSE